MRNQSKKANKLRDSGLYDAEEYQTNDYGEDYEYAMDDFDSEEAYDEDYDTVEFADDISELQEMLFESMEGMSPEESQEFSSEFLGALAAALPAVLSAAPSIIKGIGGIFGGGGRRRPRPRRRPIRRPVRPRGSSTARSIDMLSQKIDRLISVLSRS